MLTNGHVKYKHKHYSGSPVVSVPVGDDPTEITQALTKRRLPHLYFYLDTLSDDN